MEAEKLLYNTYNHHEWELEVRDSPGFQIPNSFNYSVWSILRNAGSSIRSNVSNVVYPLNTDFVSLKAQSLDWKLAASSDGKVIAVLQEGHIMTFSSESDFTECIDSVEIPIDCNQKWSLLLWTIADDFILHCSSRTILSVYDRKLHLIASCSVDPENESELDSNLQILESVDFGKCLCSIECIRREAATELLCLTYRGMLYCLSLSGSQPHLTRKYSISLLDYHAEGLFCMVHCAKFNVILTGTAFNKEAAYMENEQCGIFQYRLIDESPWLISSNGDPLSDSPRSLESSWKKWPSFLSRKSNITRDGISKIILSSSEDTLVASHWHGSISVWAVPSLRQLKKLSNLDIWGDIGCNEKIGPNEASSDSRMLLSDVQLWSHSDNFEECALVLASASGVIDIKSVGTLASLTQKQEEFPSPVEITPVYVLADGHKSFFGLEVSKRVSVMKRRFGVSESSDSGDESSDEEEADKVKERCSRFVKHSLYFLTESDRFQPPPKKPKLVTKTFRLFSFRSTTPESLFKSKLQNEEYGEALILAERYELDSDLVYMKQWRKHPVSNATIHDYLKKISKRHWILRECTERVSSDLDATKSLLMYGLQGTEIEILLSLAENPCDAFIYTDNDYVVTDDDAYLSRQQIEQKRSAHRKTVVEDYLNRFKTFESLTLEQREILDIRRKLVHYLNTLVLYEEVLGGAEAAVQSYSPRDYMHLRKKNFLEMAIEFAQSCDWRAVDTVLMHIEQLSDYRLLILTNFPETMRADEFSDILPTHNNKDEIVPLFINSLFETDWSNSEALARLHPVESPTVMEFENDILKPAPLTLKTCVEWYKWRARKVEVVTGILSFAISLLETGIDLGIPGLNVLLNDMKFLSTLVYDSQCNVFLYLEDFEKLSELERLQIIINHSTSENICANMRKYVLPRLNSLGAKQRESLFRQILLSMSLKSLTKIVRIYEECKPGHKDPIEKDHIFLMRNAVDCVYNCARCDQLAHAYAIINCLPLRTSVAYSPLNEDAFAQVDSLENHLDAAAILDKYNLQKPFAFYRTVESDHAEGTKLLNDLVNSAVKNNPNMSDDEWLGFLVQNLMHLQRKLLHKVPGQEVYEIFVTNLLRSEVPRLMKLSMRFLNLSKTERFKAFSYTNLATYKIDFECSSRIILGVASEMVDSASSVHDSCIQSALSLLKLAVDSTEEIDMEKDFIEALVMLQQYNFNYLPVQVRKQRRDSSGLLKALLKKNPGAYRSHKKILSLANLLRLFDSERERKCEAWSLIAQCALEDRYIDLTLQMCCQLIDLDHRPAWTFCWDLARADELKDAATKNKLLVFAMCHCPENVLSEIVDFKSKENIILDTPKDASVNEALFPVLNVLEKTGKTFIRETASTTKALLSFSGDQADSSCQKENEDLSSVSRDLFYDGFVISSDVASYDASSDLRRKCHQQPLRDSQRNTNECLEKCAVSTVKKDFVLALCYALACNDNASIRRILDRLPCNEVSLNFCLLAFSIMQEMRSGCIPASELFCKSPNEIITNQLESDSVDDSDVSRTFLRLKEFIQNSKLVDVHSDIDVDRFSRDERYKWDTVLGLAMTTDRKLVDLSLELASHHGIDTWSVYMTNFEYLLSESGLNVDQIKEYVSSNQLVEKLVVKNADFVEKLTDEVFLLIPDDDLEKLHFFFTVFRTIQCREVFGNAPDVHVDLLEYLIEKAPDFPYKKLFIEGSNAREIISSNVDYTNFERLSKQFSMLVIDGKKLSRSSLVLAYVQRSFRDNHHRSSDRISDLCLECVEYLEADDIAALADFVAYQDKEIVFDDLRGILSILKKCVSCLKKLKPKEKSCNPRFQKLMETVDNCSKQMNLLSSSQIFTEWLKSEGIKGKNAIRIWTEMRLKKEEEMLSLFSELIVQGVSFDELSQLIESLKIEISASTCIYQALEVSAKSVDEVRLDESSRPLLDLLGRVKAHIDGWGDLVSEEDVIAKLREITSSKVVGSLRVKIYLLEKIEQMFQLSQEDVQVLLLERTRTLLSDVFESLSVSETAIASEASRYSLICELVDSAQSSEKLSRVLGLLGVWPSFSSYGGSEHPLFAICCKWAAIDRESCLKQLKDFCKSSTEGEQLHSCWTAICEHCFSNDLNEIGLALSLALGYPEALEMAIKWMASCDGDELKNMITNEVSSLVSSGILHKLLGSSVYRIATDHVIQERDEQLLRQIVTELKSNDREHEAAELVARFSGFHPAFTMFSAGISYLSSWMSADPSQYSG